jgi:molybdenum-dependent DNA-binding transcriptional regulator ModE
VIDVVLKIGRRLSENMFLNEKLVDLYLNITLGPLNYVCKKVDINYSHAIEILNIWESMNLVVKNKAGYRYNIFYTAKGKTLFDYLSKLRTYLKRSNVQWQGNDSDA